MDTGGGNNKNGPYEINCYDIFPPKRYQEGRRCVVYPLALVIYGCLLLVLLRVPSVEWVFCCGVQGREALKSETGAFFKCI